MTKEKVMVRVTVPMANISYDLKIPRDLTSHSVTGTVIALFKQKNGYDFPLSEMPSLWRKKDGTELDSSCTVRELGITDSEELLLI